MQLGFEFATAPAQPRREARPAPRVRTPRPEVQLGLPITPSLRAQARVEAHLRGVLGPYVMVALTRNTSTMISTRRRGRVLYLRCHAMFGEAPDEVLDALAAFVGKEAIAEAQSKLLDDWIERHRATLERQKAEQPIQPVGEVHDLGAIFDRLNAEYFSGRIDARITWSIAATNKKRTSMKLGSYAIEQKLIRMHPALDQEWVPELFVEFVVFHEMLHQVHGVAEDACGRNAVHTPAFRADERRYAKFLEATRWEQRHLPKLLKY